MLNVRGGRLSGRAARDVITRLGETVGINDDSAEPFGPHVLRYTFGIRLVWAGKTSS